MWIRSLVLVVLLPVLLAAPSATQARMLYESAQITLYSTRAEPNSRNSHPITLDADMLSTVLARVQARSGEMGEIIGLFPEKHRKQIAGELAKALRSIDRDEDVYLVSFRRIGNFFSSHRNASSARVFVENGRLNMIFGQIDGFFSEFRDPDRAVPAMGLRERAASLNGRIQGTEGVTFVDGRDDWIALPLAQTAPAAPAAAPATANESPAECKSGEARDSLRGDGRITWKELEEGLTTLKQLHTKGLITDLEYEAKKKEMLDAVGPGR